MLDHITVKQTGGNLSDNGSHVLRGQHQNNSILFQTTAAEAQQLIRILLWK